MATTATSGSNSATASSDLQRIEREVRRIQQQLAQKNSGKRVQEFQKETRDVKFENNITARDIGQLKKDETRLNVFSSLGAGDTVDGFRFRVTSKTATTFSVLNASKEDEGKLRFQVFYKSNGRLLADSDAKAGVANTVYQAMRDGTFEMEKGDYVLRVSRANAIADAKKEFSYAVQLGQGLYSRDYDTIERAARASDNPYGVANVSEATTNLTGAMASAVSFMQSLPKIGTKATDKLMGMIINSVS